MDGFFNGIKKGLGDLFFPPFCVSCAKDGFWWCEDCQKKAVKIKGIICPRCLRVGTHSCDGNLPFSSVSALGYYHDPILRGLITELKFSGATVLHKEMSAWMSSIEPQKISPDVVLIPLPLSKKRMCEREFNQAELIAKSFKKAWGLKNAIRTDVLIRKRHAEAQSSLSHKRDVRRKNIRDAFACVKKPPESVILVDDVLTTGATAEEAVRALRSAGAESVSIWAVALGR